jgi:hypothetical protein
LFTPDAPDAPPLQIPVTATIPVEALLMPCEVATTVPPVTLPVTVIVPDKLLYAPYPVLVPPVAFPVIVIDPVDAF